MGDQLKVVLYGKKPLMLRVLQVIGKMFPKSKVRWVCTNMTQGLKKDLHKQGMTA